jgi:hypothetical protein
MWTELANLQSSSQTTTIFCDESLQIRLYPRADPRTDKQAQYYDSPFATVDGGQSAWCISNPNPNPSLSRAGLCAESGWFAFTHSGSKGNYADTSGTSHIYICPRALQNDGSPYDRRSLADMQQSLHNGYANFDRLQPLAKTLFHEFMHLPHIGKPPVPNDIRKADQRLTSTAFMANEASIMVPEIVL